MIKTYQFISKHYIKARLWNLINTKHDILPRKSLINLTLTAMALNLRQIEAFRAFMITGTVTKAAEVMHVTQPAVSRLLADFEYAVGFSLFERERRRLSPTTECLALYAEVERSFAGLEHIKQTASRIKDMKSGHLSIAAMPIFATTFLPDVIAKFSQEYPGITISLWTWPREQVMQWVLSQQHDLGFVTLPVNDDAIGVQPFPVDEAICMLPRNHPLTSQDTIHISDLEGEDFIALSPGIQFRQLMDKQLQEHNVKVNIRMEVSSAHIATKLVARGLGISVVGFQGLGEHQHPDIIIKPFRPMVPYYLGIVFPKQRAMSKITRKFVDVALKTYKPLEHP